MNMKNTEYKSNDLYQAVALKTAGMPLLRLEKSSGHFYIFVFDDPNNKAEEILSQFWAKTLQVDAKTFVENINEAKARIHQGL